MVPAENGMTNTAGQPHPENGTTAAYPSSPAARARTRPGSQYRQRRNGGRVLKVDGSHGLNHRPHSGHRGSFSPTSTYPQDRHRGTPGPVPIRSGPAGGGLYGNTWATGPAGWCGPGPPGSAGGMSVMAPPRCGAGGRVVGTGRATLSPTGAARTNRLVKIHERPVGARLVRSDRRLGRFSDHGHSNG